MFWYPYTGAAALSLVWPSDYACMSVGVAALVAAILLAVVVLQSTRGHRTASQFSRRRGLDAADGVAALPRPRVREVDLRWSKSQLHRASPRLR
jgi:hypothetical protein